MPQMPDFRSFSPFGRDEEVTRAAPVGAFAEAQAERSDEHQSTTIDALIARQSVLPSGSSYARVADAVLAASARSKEAELRRARMRSKAADKNWLPSLGPNVSLTSLGTFAASLLLDQVLFDNGRRAAERDFARADVEVAAVALSVDQNDRVAAGLRLYLTAEEAREKARVVNEGIARMAELDRMIAARVQGGVSDMSESQVVRAKLAEMTSTRDTLRAGATTAMAELSAMAVGSLDEVRGISDLNLPGGAETMSVLQAEAEHARTLAELDMSRAGMLPGIAAGAMVGGGGGADVHLTSDSGFGFSTPDNLRAIEAGREATDRDLNQAYEDASRRISALVKKREALTQRLAEAQRLARQAAENAEMFDRQMQAGTRSMVEAASVYETQSRLEQEAIKVRFDIAVVDVEMAREKGLLADGSRL